MIPNVITVIVFIVPKNIKIEFIDESIEDYLEKTNTPDKLSLEEIG